MPDSPKCFECKIFDGAAVVHFLPTSSVNTFAEYADKIFVPFLQQQLKQSRRLDLVWDRYIDNSIKQAAREQRGHGTRTKVSAQTKMPKKWSDFLRVSQNKQELFSFLTKAITNMETGEEKILCATSGK